MWTVPQRRALIALISAAAVALAVRAYLSPVYLGDISPPHGSRSAERTDTIDPNTATAVELETIPDLGRIRAEAIVAYREKFVAAHPGHVAFSRPEDLRNVKGFGAAMVERLRPFMRFESEQTP